MTFTQVPVIRTYLTGTGTPATGTVSLRLTSPLTNGGQVVDMTPVTRPLGSDGSVSFTMPANDDVGTYPGGVTCRVDEAIAGQPVVTYYFEVLAAAAVAGIDLATVTRTDQPGRTWTVGQALNQRGLPGGYPSLDAAGRVPMAQLPDGLGGGGGGGTSGVSSVNGHSGAVVLSAADLSAYSKSEADAKFASATSGVSSVNGKTGAAVLSATDVGAYSVAAADGKFALISQIPSVPVTSVAGKTGAVTLSAADVGALSQATADGRYVQASAIPVTSVNGRSGAVVVGAGDPSILGWYNVRNFAAVGDGVTVDSAAIQAAVNAASSAGGGLVYVPAGTWVCSGVYLASNVTLMGAGMGATVLKMDPAATPGTNAWVIRVANGSTALASYVTVRDLTIDGNKSTWATPGGRAYGYYLGTATVGNVTDCAVERVEIRNCNTYGLDIVNALRVAVTDCWSHDNGLPSGAYNNASGFEILADDVTLVNCRATGNANKGFISGESGVTHYRTKFIGCTAQGNTSDGFNLHDGLVNSSILGGASRDNGGTGATLASSSARNSVIGLICTGNASNGIRLDNSSYNVVSSCVCDGNATASSGNPEIYLVTGTNHNTVSSCIVNSVVSSTSIVEHDTSDFNTFRGNTYNKTFTLLGANSNAVDPAVALSTERINSVALSGAAQTIPSPTSFSISDITLSNACTLTLPAAAAGTSFTLALRQDATGSRTVTWPAGVKWASGTAPTLTATASSLDMFSFVCLNGTDWIGFVSGQDLR